MTHHPTPAEIREAREAAGLNQEQAGELLHGSRRTWQNYELGYRVMHPAIWELFNLKVEKLLGDAK